MEFDNEIKATFISVQHRAIVNMGYTMHFLRNLQVDFLSSYQLSLAQFNILRILRGAGGFININTVKQRMVEKSPNTTRLMDKLIEKELIIRMRSETDRRAIEVRITGKGLALLEKTDQDIRMSELTQLPLNEKEAKTLNELLDKIRTRKRNQ
jgi:MarR family 2-MHQ and catechol resistance regulon transcriptional repressor